MQAPAETNAPDVEKRFGLDDPENVFKARAVAAEAWFSYFEAKIADAAQVLRRLESNRPSAILG